MLAFAGYFSFHAHHHGVGRRKMSTPGLRVRVQVDRRMTITITQRSAMSFNAKILIYVIAGLLIVAASLVGPARPTSARATVGISPNGKTRRRTSA